MSVCDSVRSCPFRLRHTAWLWRRCGWLGSYWSSLALQVGIWPNCGRTCKSERECERESVRERALERESAPAVVMFGLLRKMLSASAVVGRMCFFNVFNDVSVWSYLDGLLNNVTRAVILQAFLGKCTDCVPVSDWLYLAFIQLLFAHLNAPYWCQLL